MSNNFTTPAGRMVGGDLYNGKTTDGEGRPLVYKSGDKIGQPRKDYYVAIAIPKGPEQHWSTTPWGAVIWAKGHASFPGGQAQTPKFSWKIIDGDSTIPNTKGTKPCDREGYKGNWVLAFSGAMPPKLYRLENGHPVPALEAGAIKPGYFIQINGDVASNDSMQQPGVYLNHGMVCLLAFGPEIVFGPDVAAAGFGQGVQLPAGATSMPAPAAVLPAAPAVPAAAAPVAPAVPVVPNPAILAVPVAPVAPVAPAPTGPRMTEAATSKGWTYEMPKGGGWTDEQMIQQGLMLPQ
jgi:hypothetical protein